MVTTPSRRATEADLWATPDDPKYELVDGEIRRTPLAGARHSCVNVSLMVRLGAFVNRAREVLDKVGEYLDAGVRLVWVVDPESRTATRYRSLSDVKVLTAGDDLDGEDVLPGFRCPLAEILE